jgi:uncharacterized protein
MPIEAHHNKPYHWIKNSIGSNLVLVLTIQPKASQDKYCGELDNSIKLQITAAPTDGKANAHLMAYLAKQFRVPKSSVQLLKGENSRHKKISIHAPKSLPEWIKPEA